MLKLANPLRGRTRRGFTLIEMMIVVVIIGLFAALATPSVTSLVQDQRVRRSSLNMMNLYRDARARALGRGAAISVVSFSPSPTYPWEFTVTEAQSVVGPATLPDPRCRGYGWNGATAGQTPVQLLDVTPGTGTGPSDLQVTATYSTAADAGVASTGYLEVCFTPAGKVFVRNGAGGQFLPLNGRAGLTVQRTVNGSPLGFARKIQINPDGTTRVAL